MDDYATKKHQLLLDLLALEAEVIRVMKLNSAPPHIPESEVLSRDLIAARDLVKAPNRQTSEVNPRSQDIVDGSALRIGCTSTLLADEFERRAVAPPQRLVV